MLQRLFIHNFKTFQNFEWKPADMQSCLLVGKNGVGKSSIAKTLLILQQIGQGTTATKDLLKKNEWFANQTINAPLRIEIDILIQNKIFEYKLAFEFPDGFRYPKVMEESLFYDGQSLLSRKEASVKVKQLKSKNTAEFFLDWHSIALPMVQSNSVSDPIQIFRVWLASMVILSPIPTLMYGSNIESNTTSITENADNFVSWLSQLIKHYPATYSSIDKHLKKIIPDFESLQFEHTTQRLSFNFAQKQNTLKIDFEHLSDGEKCFALFATIMAANTVQNPLFCFWDEPDKYLTLSEVGYFIRSLRATFEKTGQIIMASHHAQTITSFSKNNIWVLSRYSHIEPTQIRLCSEFTTSEDVINDLVTGDFWNDE